MNSVTVLIVDDHIVARAGLRAILETDPGMCVVEEASDGVEAVAKVTELHPDVVLMDVRMPLMDGLEATRQIKANHPTTSIIMMTSYDEDALVIDSVRAGAAGYLLKDTSRDLLLHTIWAVVSGGILVKATLLRKAVEGLAAQAQFTKVPLQNAQAEQLTEREREVLKLIVEGRTNRVIADTLSLAEVTVKKHVQSVIAKLGASDRTQAAVTAIRSGLLS